MSKQRKAVALISGGLDSMLAAKIVMEQGVHVEGINFILMLFVLKITLSQIEIMPYGLLNN